MHDSVLMPSGTYTVGAPTAPHPQDGETPLRPVSLDAYRIAAHAVSNAEFAAFVRASGHRTTAEIRGTSHVFDLHLRQPERHPAPLAEAPWWRSVKGANWQRPDGLHPALPDHPVVHVSFEDAQAYCRWSGTRLPTEAEWECAAQGSEQQPLNIWRGQFPHAPLGTPGTRAVDDAQPNNNGLYHACGNVWEWTADGFGRLHSPRETRNPAGNLASLDKVVKGGSYLCAPSYCARYRPSARRPETPSATTGHMGFRVAIDVNP